VECLKSNTAFSLLLATVCRKSSSDLHSLIKVAPQWTILAK
jgi:hypothetical protein